LAQYSRSRQPTVTSVKNDDLAPDVRSRRVGGTSSAVSKVALAMLLPFADEDRPPASIEGDLAVGFPPAVRLPLATSRMARTTDCLHIVIHHLAKSLQAGSQAERLKARNDVR
jgi:hypothetical protein